MSASKISGQVIDLATRFFPEWVELMEERIAPLVANPEGEGMLEHDGPDKAFASMLIATYREQKGARYGSVAEKNTEITDYLIAVKDSDLSDEEIRWQLIEKLGGVD